ncbi:MAG: hypothetical protein IVW57_00080 [Ktedonobacterales bacterium]|nr:hypothetical protein [Ktedonobacterales bacterium]
MAQKTVGMFLGAETVNWSLAQFTAAARLSKSLGCTEMAVKCADGSVVWYASQGGLAAVRNACLAGGLDMLPYQYSYGNKFGALGQEIAVCKQLMQLRPDGAAMVDMEVEWNGQVGWAQTWNAALAPVKGILYLTTWGNPATQGWSGVIAALRGRVNVWVPQEYDTVLVNDEGQYPSGLAMQPALNLPEAWPGPNDPVQAARTAMSRGHDGVWLWEYGLATGNHNVVQQIAAVVNPGGSTPPPPPPSGGATMVPTGWKDDGTTLTAPNGLTVALGFRLHVLGYPGGWPAWNWPVDASVGLPSIELGNPTIGAGDRQIFRDRALGYTLTRDVYEMWTGQELAAWIARSASQDATISDLTRKNLTLQGDAAALAAAQTRVGDLTAQVASLTQQIAALQAQLQQQQNTNAATTAIAALAAALKVAG